MNPRDKEIVSECQQLVAYDGVRRGNNTQIRDLHFSDTINKVQSISSLPNSQFGHIVSIATSISDALASSVKTLIEEGILIVDDGINLYCICHHIMPYQETDNNILSTLKLSPMFILDSISMHVGCFTCFKFSSILGPK